MTSIERRRVLRNMLGRLGDDERVGNVVCREGESWWWRGGWNVVKRERERDHDLLLYASKKVCDVWKSDGEAKGVETKQARLVSGRRNHVASRSSMKHFLARVLIHKRWS